MRNLSICCGEKQAKEHRIASPKVAPRSLAGWLIKEVESLKLKQEKIDRKARKRFQENRIGTKKNNAIQNRIGTQENNAGEIG